MTVLSSKRVIETRLHSILALICLLSLAILLPVSSAFPLTGSNGVVNATVYGVVKGGSNLYLDMSASDKDSKIFELIDSEDRVYGSLKSFGEPRTACYFYNGSIRDTIAFSIPESVEIKRVKVTPTKSDPFMIEWTGVPESRGSGIMLKFYGATSESMNGPTHVERHLYKWTFDIKITNSGDGILSFETGEIMLKDTVGWIYSDRGIGGGETKKLLPGESIRFPLEFNRIGEFSRPSELIFRDLTMNIEAWI